MTMATDLLFQKLIQVRLPWVNTMENWSLSISVIVGCRQPKYRCDEPLGYLFRNVWNEFGQKFLRLVVRCVYILMSQAVASVQ